MKVSVAIVTYNHAPFIRRAVEGALMQRTNFDFEILVGEDDSTDGTREIVKEYAAQYPGKIRLFLRDRKDVLQIAGRSTGRRNLVNTLKEARGDYVALLEGDDYWTSPDKLQKQADFLDAHPECSACFHPVQVIYENGEVSDLTCRKVARDFYTQADILAAGFHIPTCSYFYRNRLFGEFPEWYFTVPVGDLPLHVLVAQHGLLGWMNENMGVYRVHGGGMSSGGAREASWPPEQRLRRAAVLISYYEIVDRALAGKHHDIIRDKLSMLNYDMVGAYQEQGNLSMMRRHLRQAAHAKLMNAQTPAGFIFKTHLVAYGFYFEAIYRGWRKFKSPSGK